MPKAPFDNVWLRINNHEGETFHTKASLKFHYKIEGEGFVSSRAPSQRISQNDFEKAYELVPIDGPGKINNLVRGPAYVWAVLHDRRISMGEW